MQRTQSAVQYTEEEEALGRIAKALGHPVRVRILKLLLSESCCFTGQLTDFIPMAQSTVSQHLKVLLDSGLIQGEINPPKVRYCINRENWVKAEGLLKDFLFHPFMIGVSVVDYWFY